MIAVHLTPAELEAVLRALDASSVARLHRNEREREDAQPGPHETAAARLRAAACYRIPRAAAAHLRADHGGPLNCLRCGETYSPTYPCPIGAWAAVAAWFARTHHDCRALRVEEEETR